MKTGRSNGRPVFRLRDGTRILYSAALKRWLRVRPVKP